MIGYSLSGCVRDIIKGAVNIDDVVFIISGTSLTNRDQIAAYARTEVSPKQADAFTAAVETLWDRGAIFQSTKRPPMGCAFVERWRTATASECGL